MKKLLSRLALFYLRFFAQIAIELHRPIIIGIAGSVGKSSTRNALYALLKDYYKTKMVYGNSETGIPLGILGITQNGFSPLNWIESFIRAPFGIFYLKGTNYLIVEMGIDEPFPPKNMSYLLTIIKPDIAISLNVSATHTEQFEVLIPKDSLFSPSEKRDFLINKIAEEDTKIVSKGQPKLAIINADNTYITTALSSYKLRQNRTIHTFGKNEINTIWYKNYNVNVNGTTFSFGLREENITLSFVNLVLPKEYQELFAAVILVGKYLKLSSLQITQALEKNYTLPPGRGSIFTGIHDTLIIDSSYNASKDAVSAFLSLTSTLHEQTKRPVVFLFGDMRELGQESEIEHTDIAKEILESVDYLYCVGNQTKQFVLPYIKLHSTKKLIDYKWFESSIAAGKYLKTTLPENCILLVKGSQNTIFLEEALPYILDSKNDVKKLCRQDIYWKKIKENSNLKTL